MRTYSAIPQQPTVHTAILSTFTAEGLTRQEALIQSRRAEVILRHDPFAPSPYIVAISSPAFALDGSGAPMRRDHVWDFATFDEARAWFAELFNANTDMIVARQQPLKRERENTAVPWKVGDAEILSRLIPYDIWLARTQSRLNKAAVNSQTAVPKQTTRIRRSTPARGKLFPVQKMSRLHGTTQCRPLQVSESFFSYGN